MGGDCHLWAALGTKWGGSAILTTAQTPGEPHVAFVVCWSIGTLSDSESEVPNITSNVTIGREVRSEY